MIILMMICLFLGLWCLGVIVLIIVYSVIGSWMAVVCVSMILVTLLAVESVSFVAFYRRTTVSCSECKIEDIFLYFLDNFLKFWRFVFDYCLIFLDL